MCHLRDRTGVSLGGDDDDTTQKRGGGETPVGRGEEPESPACGCPPQVPRLLQSKSPVPLARPRLWKVVVIGMVCGRKGKTHVFVLLPPSSYVGMGRGLVEGTDFCLRVKFVVKSGSLRKGKEERGSEWLNLINKMSETELARFHSPHCSFSLLFKVRV